MYQRPAAKGALVGPTAPWFRVVGALAWLHYQKYNMCNRVKSRLVEPRELPIS